MRKSTIMIIAIVYIASIVLISFFGMKLSVYNEFRQVDLIICRNQTDERSTVGQTSSGKMLITTKFTTPADKETITGTMIQLLWKVEPDNATNKEVEFRYDKTNTLVEFYKTEDGRETGLVLFYGRTMLNVSIVAKDGRGAIKELTLWAY